jgi:hypothetical protein
MGIDCPVGGRVLIGDIVSQANDNEERLDNIDTYGAVPRPIWEWLYYADEANRASEPEGDRVLGMDTENMVLANEIPLGTDNSHAGSCDRVGRTNKMYVRTAGYDHLEVLDVEQGKYIKTIPLPHHPRSSGGFNKYRNLQAISTKVFPWVVVIDVDTDTVVFQDGRDEGTPSGNDGGNATGHTVWLDANHFALLDRHADWGDTNIQDTNIKVYKINNDYPPYDITVTQTLDTPTGCHSLRTYGTPKVSTSDVGTSGHLLDGRVFFAAIEGDDDPANEVVPEMWKMTFDSATGTFSTPEVVTFPGTDKGWGIHHFGVSSDGKTILVPIFHLNNPESVVYKIDVDTWTVDSTTYNAGMRAGHADYCSDLNVWAITNHDDKFVTVIDMNDGSTTNIELPTLVSYTPSYGHMVQSHANHIIGKYFYIFDCEYGEFYKIDLSTKTIHSHITTGGRPVQSVS